MSMMLVWSKYKTRAKFCVQVTHHLYYRKQTTVMGILTAIFTFLVAASYLVILVLAQTEKNPTVTIKHGQIEGETLKSIKGREYSAFAGIPYAKPPIGDLRFEAPEPIEPWEGILKTTTKNATYCPQASSSTNELIGDEDCLFINVYTPKLANQSNSSLPVMVFIHGGGYVSGSGNFIEFGAQRLMDRDVVLVTLNYRVGPLGFLATSHEEFAGNYGLLDQIAALKWVQENIEAFGGNKSKVTIFGESAGGGSVTLLLLSPLAKDLFHGAIAQSGSALCPWSVNHHPTTFTKFLSVKLNCTTFPIESMKECLRNKTWEQILTKSKGFEVFNGYTIIHKPNIDKYVVPDDPKVLFQEGKLNKVPVILGINKDEGARMFAYFRQWYPRTGEGGIKMPFTWPPYETKNLKCIDLNLNSTETDKCEPEHTGLWLDEIPDMLKNK